MKDVYISYLQKDRSTAIKIVEALERFKISCYFSMRDAKSEYCKALRIVDAISDCKLVVVIASRSINRSKEIFDELDIAKGKEKPVLLVFTDEFTPSDELRKRLDMSRIYRANHGDIRYHLKMIVREAMNFVTTSVQDFEAENNDFPIASYNESKPFIFVSYSHRNSEKVLKIVERLQKDGYRVWYDEGIDPGTEWDEFIADKIEKSGFLIAFMSQEYLDSQNCKDELNYARDLDKDRLLVYLSDVKLAGGMAMRLNRLQAIHEYTYSSFDSFIEKLESTPALEAFKD